MQTTISIITQALLAQAVLKTGIGGEFSERVTLEEALRWLRQNKYHVSVQWNSIEDKNGPTKNITGYEYFVQKEDENGKPLYCFKEPDGRLGCVHTGWFQNLPPEEAIESGIIYSLKHILNL